MTMQYIEVETHDGEVSVASDSRIADKQILADAGRTPDMFGMRAAFIFEMRGDVLIISDMQGELSVTRDIVHVLKRIRNDMGKANLTDRVIYRDQHGIYDGILVDNAFGFIGFYEIGTDDRIQAVSRARARK